LSAVLVDSNVLIDLLNEDGQWYGWSAASIARVSDRSRLVINPIIYAEISVHAPTIEELDDALPTDLFAREALPYEAGFLAGKAFLAYRRRGEQKHRRCRISLSARMRRWPATRCSLEMPPVTAPIFQAWR